MASGNINIDKVFYAEYTAPEGTALKTAFLNALLSVPRNTGITVIKFAITNGESGTIIYNYESRRAFAQCGTLYDFVINSSYNALAICRQYSYTTI